MTRVWAAFVGAALLAGCAGYSVQRDGQGPGYDVYTPEPYLLRKPLRDGNGKLSGFDFAVVWLPNYSKRYRVHAWSGLGKGDFKFTFDEGWQLTSIEADLDNTKILEQLVDLTKKTLSEGVLQATTAPSSREA